MFSKQTSTAALAFTSLYFLYGLFYIPFTRFLVSLAVGGIVFGYTESYEYAAIGVFAMNFLFPIFATEGFQTKEGFQSTNPVQISQTIQQIQRGTYGKADVKGVGSKLSEGFADADTSGDLETKKTDKDTEKAEVEEKETKPEPKEDKPKDDKPKDDKPAEKVSEKFQDNGSLFKLGQIPVDTKGGNHIDAGTTVVNALSALQPDQIKQMTSDTKQLIETQKSLMGMLQTFQPMMSEGKQMMDTFQQMFTPTTTK
jgi:hypothetical protein